MQLVRRRSTLAALSAPAALLLSACHGGGFFQETHVGSGVAAEESRQVGEFSRVSLAVPADAWVRQGPETSVVLRGDDNLLPLIETRLRGDQLVVEMDGNYRSDLGIEVHVTTPRLAGVSIAGSGDMQVEGVESESFDVSIAGSGDVIARGSVGRLDASIAGSGDMLLYDLQASEASVSIAGSGDVRLSATTSLDVSIAGSGDVTYRGDPKLSLSVAGSGAVHRE